MVPSRILAVALLASACGSRSERGHSLVLVTLDTTRADVIAGALHDPAHFPAFASLAERVVGFPRAYTTAPLTLPAHASILTGLTPPRHGIRDNGLAALADEAVTLPEILSGHGYATAAFVSSVVLDRSFGLDQGFDLYDEPSLHLRTGFDPENERPADATVARACAWLEELDRDRPFFLWVHFYDPHLPYEPEPRHLEKARGDAYRGEVVQVDAALGRLLATLERLDLSDDTLLALTADHGESLGEHGEPTHGALCYEATVRVPFYLCFPGEVPLPGPAHIASVVDLMPTLLGRLGLPVPAGLDGIDLFRPDNRRDRGVYFESYSGYLYYGWSPLAGWRDPHGKYLHSSKPELYRLPSDPAEIDDQARVSPEDCAAARAAIAELFSRPALPPRRSSEDPRLDAALSALGYASGSLESGLPGPLEPTDRPDPRSLAGELVPLLGAHTSLAAGRFEEALALARRILARNPAHLLALDIQAVSDMELGHFEAAEEALLRRLDGGPQRADTWLNLGHCRLERGDREGARAAFERARTLAPTRPEVEQAFARLDVSDR
jgi:choline-sulfatase